MYVCIKNNIKTIKLLELSVCTVPSYAIVYKKKEKLLFIFFIISSEPGDH